jgi:hypothetical protein
LGALSIALGSIDLLTQINVAAKNQGHLCRVADKMKPKQSLPKATTTMIDCKSSLTADQTAF